MPCFSFNTLINFGTKQIVMKLLLILMVLHEVIGGWETWEPWDSCHNGYKKRQRGFISHYQTQNTRCLGMFDNRK